MTLRGDVLMQTAVGRDEALASAPTFSRLENRATRAQAWSLHGVLIEQFIASHEEPPEELVDIDASDVPLHGNQELSQFHAYYDHHCYLPLYVFCGQAMLACYLRPSKIDGAKHAAALIKLLVTRLRKVWPTTRFIVRGDSGFCRRRLLHWCERGLRHRAAQDRRGDPAQHAPRAGDACQPSSAARVVRNSRCSAGRAQPRRPQQRRDERYW